MGSSSDLFEMMREHGPTIYKLASAAITGYRIKRLERLTSQLQEFDSEKLVSFLKSESGFQLFEMVAERVIREHSQAKRDRYANLIVSSWVDGKPIESTIDEGTLFVEAVNEFTGVHISILSTLFDARSGQTVAYDELGAFTPEEKVIAVNSLCSRYAMVRRSWNLGRPDIRSSILYSNHLSPEGIAQKCFHKITRLGESFVNDVIRGKIAET